MYGQHLEANLQALHEKLHRMAYRPQPVRRVEIPKDDGSMRPLGISCTEDKIVQEMDVVSWRRSTRPSFSIPRMGSDRGGAVMMPCVSSTR